MTVTKIITDKKTITSITLLMDECVNFMKGQWQQHHHHDHDLLRSFPTFCWSASWSPPPRSPPRTLLMPTADGTGNPFFWTLVKFFFLAECKTKTFLQGLGLLWLLLHNSVHSRDHVENVRLWRSSKGRIYAIARFEWPMTEAHYEDFLISYCCCCLIVKPVSKSFGHARGWSLPRVNHIQRQVFHLHLSIFDHLPLSISLPLFRSARASWNTSVCPLVSPLVRKKNLDHIYTGIYVSWIIWSLIKLTLYSLVTPSTV